MDAKLPYDFSFTAEGLVSEVVSGVLFQSINFTDNKAQFAGADNRPSFATTGNAAKIDPTFTNVFVLGNTSKGHNYNAPFTLAKRIPNRLDASSGYCYGVSKDVVNGVRVSPAKSSWPTSPMPRARCSYRPGSSTTNWPSASPTTLISPPGAAPTPSATPPAPPGRSSSTCASSPKCP